MREGVSFLVHDRVLRALTLAWMIFLFGAGATLVAELPLAQLLGAGALGYGLFTTMWAGGAALGAFAGSRARSLPGASRSRSWPAWCSWGSGSA